MTIRKQLIEYACPNCNAAYGFLPEKAGSEASCNRCNNNFTVPVGLPARMVSVSTGRGRPLTAEETEAFYNSPDGQAYLASQSPGTGGSLARRDSSSGAITMGHSRPDAHSPSMVRHDDDMDDFNLRILDKFEVKTKLDKQTRASVFSVIVGGLLVALGAILGLKSGPKRWS